VVVAEGAAGIQPGLAAAGDQARVEDRPELDRAGTGPGRRRASSGGPCRRKLKVEVATEADMTAATQDLGMHLNLMILPKIWMIWMRT
jgi:hypothetical protein